MQDLGLKGARAILVKRVTHSFLERWIVDIQAGDRILDLGSGDFYFAKQFISLLARVDCVDNQVTEGVPEGARYFQLDVRRVCEFNSLIDIRSYKRFFVRNLLQFIERQSAEDLLSCICKHAVPGSHIYIESFFSDPNPSFEVPYHSYWTSRDLRNLLNSRRCRISTAEQTTLGRDEAGKLRTFFSSMLDGELL